MQQEARGPCPSSCKRRYPYLRRPPKLDPSSDAIVGSGEEKRGGRPGE